MANENKVITALADGFEVFYVDTQFRRKYPYQEVSGQLSPQLKKLQFAPPKYREKRYQKIEKLQLNRYQHKVFRDALYGLQCYSPLQVQSMSSRQKDAIMSIHQKAQLALKKWKQKLFYDLVDDYLLHGIPGFDKLKNKINQVLRADGGVNPQINDSDVEVSFADLGITQKDISHFLIQQGILPANLLKAAA